MFLMFGLTLILINFKKVVITLSTEEMEITFNNDMINRNAHSENPLCALNRGQKNTYCRALFQMPRFKTSLAAEFNSRAFARYDPQCSAQKIYFKTPNLHDDWHQKILPCFGRHRIPRTSWHEDPFYVRFFVAFSPPKSIMYVFAEDRTGEEDRIYIVDVATVKTDPFSLGETTVIQNEIDYEEYLNDLEVHTLNIRQVEATYVRDMIRDTSFPPVDPFEEMEGAKILTVCLSVFTDIKYTIRGIFIDRQEMFTPTYGPVQKLVYFNHEGQRDGHPQKTYPCPALHVSHLSTKSATMKDMYSIAAGRKPNSIFVFQVIDYANNVQLVEFIENFDFAHLEPSEQSETEIYPYTEHILQNIQPVIPVH